MPVTNTTTNVSPASTEASTANSLSIPSISSSTTATSESAVESTQTPINELVGVFTGGDKESSSSNYRIKKRPISGISNSDIDTELTW